MDLPSHTNPVKLQIIYTPVIAGTTYALTRDIWTCRRPGVLVCNLAGPR